MSIILDGVNQSLTATVTAPTGDFTFCGWVYVDTASATMTAMGLGSGGTHWILNKANGGSFYVRRNGVNYAVGTAGAFAATTWYFIAGTYTAETGGGSNGAINLYLRADGSGASWDATHTESGLTDVTLATTLTIGALDGTTWPWDGLIGPVKIWDGVVLSSAQLLQEYPYRDAVNETGNVLASYRFASGAITTDDSGNGVTLTNNNTVTVQIWININTEATEVTSISNT